MSDPSPLRVFVVDDHEFVRLGLRDLLAQDPATELVGESAGATGCVEVIGVARPDVVALDLRLTDGDGLALCRTIKAEFPDVRCLVLTGFGDDRLLVEASEAGADGFAVKSARSHELLDAIKAVGAGRQLLDRATVRHAAERLRSTPEGLVATLSPQERRVFDLIGSGHSNREIAEALGLTEKTAKNYVSAVLAKLSLRSRTQVAAVAARLAANQT